MTTTEGNKFIPIYAIATMKVCCDNCKREIEIGEVFFQDSFGKIYCKECIFKVFGPR